MDNSKFYGDQNKNNKQEFKEKLKQQKAER